MGGNSMTVKEAVGSLPTAVIEKDHELEMASEGKVGELMKHRWHWTADEANPARVSVRAYASQVGVNQAAVSRDARAFVLLGDDPWVVTPTEARDRARVGVEKEAATDAVAKRHGVGFSHTMRKHDQEVRHVL